MIDEELELIDIDIEIVVDDRVLGWFGGPLDSRVREEIELEETRVTNPTIKDSASTDILRSIFLVFFHWKESSAMAL